MRRPLPRRLALVLGAVAVLALLVLALYRHEVRGEQSPVARGEQLAHVHGCFACHARSESEPRLNYRRLPNGEWRSKRIPTFWENGLDDVDVLIEWIALGHPPAEQERHRALFIQMPAYGDLMPADDQEAIAAWILAQSLPRILGEEAGDPPAAEAPEGDPLDRLWRDGDRLSRQHGCYQCHGELGQGGVPNPAAFKGYIPGFFGADFRALTKNGDRDEILHWIDHGRGRAIESGALGRLATYFAERQVIGMPAYADRLTPVEKTLLVDYLLHLNRAGPLDARAVEQVTRRLSEN